MPRRSLSSAAGLLLVALSSAGADPPAAKPGANSPAEPVAPELSLPRAGELLDSLSLTWTRERKCGTCHTNYPYLFARPAVPGPLGAAYAEVRQFFEGRALGWESEKPLWDTEVVATAAALALSDAQTTRELHPATRKALDAMWKLQREDGSWDWLKCNWPPFESDDDFGVVFAAVGVGAAPGGYAQSEQAQKGLTRLRGYLKSHPPPSAHHRAWLLWASTLLPGLLEDAARKDTLGELLSLQRPDGGWNVASLGPWKRHDGSANDPAQASDGYATGLIVFVARQAGVPADDPRLARGVAWLKAHQRASGRWFTRSPSNDGRHYLTHTGTAFAVLALAACGDSQAER